MLHIHIGTIFQTELESVHDFLARVFWIPSFLPPVVSSLCYFHFLVNGGEYCEKKLHVYEKTVNRRW
jgi:hypothetical protein